MGVRGGGGGSHNSIKVWIFYLTIQCNVEIDQISELGNVLGNNNFFRMSENLNYRSSNYQMCTVCKYYIFCCYDFCCYLFIY